VLSIATEKNVYCTFLWLDREHTHCLTKKRKGVHVASKAAACREPAETLHLHQQEQGLLCCCLCRVLAQGYVTTQLLEMFHLIIQLLFRAVGDQEPELGEGSAAFEAHTRDALQMNSS
jgi:hypothetical protein